MTKKFRRNKRIKKQNVFVLKLMEFDLSVSNLQEM